MPDQQTLEEKQSPPKENRLQAFCRALYNRLLDLPWGWKLVILGAFSLGLQAMAFKGNPSLICYLVSAGSEENIKLTLEVWAARGITKMHLVGAVLADFLLIVAYCFGLLGATRWATNPNDIPPTNPNDIPPTNPNDIPPTTPNDIPPGDAESPTKKTRLTIFREATRIASASNLHDTVAKIKSHIVEIYKEIISPNPQEKKIKRQDIDLPAFLYPIHVCVIIAAILDAIENALLLVYFLFGVRFSWEFLSWNGAIKFVFLGIAVWYILQGFRKWHRWPPARNVIRYSGFSIFACIAAPGILYMGGQGPELFHIISSRNHAWEIFLSVFSMVVFSLACWGCARIILDYAVDDIASGDEQAEGIQKTAGKANKDATEKNLQGEEKPCWTVDWVPRLTAYISMLILLLMSIQGSNASWLTAWTAVAFTAIVAWTCFRRRLANDDFWVVFDRRLAAGIWLIGLSVLIWFGLLGPYQLVKVSGIGPLAAWLLGFAFSIPFFSYLVLLGRKYTFPVLGFTIAYVVLINALDLNDNHGVRYAKTPGKQSETINKGFTKWLTPRIEEWRKTHGDQPYPVLFVAAEGGGIRSAAQVTTTLAQFNREPEDARHLFAISGVSGSSLGAAVYGALVQSEGADPAKWERKARAILTADLLSPSVASLAGPELVQRFLPFPIPRFPADKGFVNEWQLDRGRALDVSLSEAYREATKTPSQPEGSSLLAQRLSDYPAPSAGDAPALFFNTACVETGRAMVISTLSVDHADRLRPAFETLSDIRKDADIELSVAACLSARFPLISPPGFLLRTKSESIPGAPVGFDKMTTPTVKMRFVDGGYNDNTGVGTVASLMDILRNGDEQFRRGLKWRPVVLVIRFVPQSFDKLKDQPYSLDARKPAPHQQRATGFDEILGPIQAFANGWGGRGRPKRDELSSRLGPAYCEIIFGNASDRKPHILGWYLSEDAYDDLAGQLMKENQTPGGRPDEGDEITILRQQLQ